MAVKGIDGLLELVGGTAVLVLGPSGLERVVTLATRHELRQDPGDPVARWLAHQASDLGVHTVHFAAAYLLVHGLVKVGLVTGLIRERLRVFPLALAVLGLFLVFQLQRLATQFSAGLALLSVLDLVIIALVWQEYRALRSPGGRA